MASVQVFLDRVKPGSEAETMWLKDIFNFITQQVCPVSPTLPTTGEEPLDWTLFLSVTVVKKIQENTNVSHTLPVSYRPVSVSELLSQQNLPCVSHLSWTTNQQREWTKEAELSLPGSKALPRVNLLLIGCLTPGEGGEWRLTDSSGSVRCEILFPSPLWLNRLVFLPHWNYIPHNATGQQEYKGCVELIGSPVLLSPGPELVLTDSVGVGGLSRVVGVREAAGMVQHRIRRQRVSVSGRVGSVCPVLIVSGTTFFCFTLTDDGHTLPVLIRDVGRLWWSQCVCVGQNVCVTALRVCVLRGWRGNNILCVTDQSEIHTDYTRTPENENHAHHTSHTQSQLDMPPPMMSHSRKEMEAETPTVQSGFWLRESRVITYQGTVTEVVSEGAGLFIIDRQVGLCLAYQPSLTRKLRVGDKVELHHVHFLYRACPDFPPTILCTCLSSSIRVTEFSRVRNPAPDSRCPGKGIHRDRKRVKGSRRILIKFLTHNNELCLVPSVLRQQCVCVLSWKLMEIVWRGRGGGKRDIYSEMLDKPHTCPLTQYTVDPAVHQYISLSELRQSLRSHCWSSLSLNSLLPPGGSNLTSSEINTALAWSSKTLTSDPQIGASLRQRPLLVVGVLELPSHTSEHKHTLLLRDETGALSCVVTEASETDEGSQTAAFNTAWIGCLVCVQQFTMVLERFLHSNFPSYQHLDQEGFITHRHCRVYLQFRLDHLHVLSPSVAMVTHLEHRGVSLKKTPKVINEREEERDSSGTVVTQPCISMVIRVEKKEGVAWTNTGVELKEKEVGLTPNFLVRAAVIGPVVTWGWNPKNKPITERETERGRKEQVVLLFSGVASRWFPLLQPGCFYRVIAVNTQDLSVMTGCGVSGQKRVKLHTDSTLQVRPEWRFHTVTRPLQICTQMVSSTVLSVSEVLDSSSELVNFQGLVSGRISLNHRNSESGPTDTGVRLTMCDHTGRSLQVYLDLGHTPYPPGLLPGNKLLLSGFQRKVSRSGSVYCTYLPVSSVTVICLGDSSSTQPPPVPIMHLGVWDISREQMCIVGQVKGHVVCFLFLHLQWSCSLCGSLYTQSCSSSQCGSTSSVFQSKAKLVIDDGTGEAHVWVSGDLVRPLLGLSHSQWEGLQRVLRVRGQVRVYPRGRGLVSDGDSDDFLLRFLLCVCSSDIVCRPISLTCRKLSSLRAEELRRFGRGDRDFVTRMTRPLQLSCLSITTTDLT